MKVEQNNNLVPTVKKLTNFVNNLIYVHVSTNKIMTCVTFCKKKKEKKKTKLDHVVYLIYNNK
jgi:hypothetical protein